MPKAERPPLGRRRPWSQAPACPELVVDANGDAVALMPTADVARIVVDAVNFRHPRTAPWKPGEHRPWRQASDDPGRIEDGHGNPIGWMWRPELAAMVVAAANAWREPERSG